MGKEKDNHQHKTHRHKINCNTCLALVSLFYSSSMSAIVREAIVCHLIKCNKCLQRYANYEANHPEFKKVDVVAVIKKLREELEDKESVDDSIDSAIEITSSYTIDSNEDSSHFNPTKWQDAATNFDIEALMNLKFFRDLINSYDYDKANRNLDYSDFYKYISRKITKRVDLLEACLRKEYVTKS